MSGSSQHRSPRAHIAGISSADAIGVAVVYLLTSVIKLGMLYWMRGESTLTSLLLKWDSRHYLDIAQYGYFQAKGEGPWDAAVYQERLAFFPALPMLIRVFALVPGVDHAAAGLFINTIATVVLALGIVALARTLGAGFSGRMLACLLILGAPMAITFNMVYTEAMFLACVVWALRAMLRREFLVAALITAVAGLMRLTAIDLWVVLVLAVLWHYWEPQIRRWLSLGSGGAGAGTDTQGRAQPKTPADSGKWLALAASGLAIVPLGAYLLWASYYTRDVGGYFGIQRAGWHSSFDFGAATLRWVSTQMRETTEPGYVLSIVVIVLAALTILLTFRRVPWQLWVFGLTLGLNVLLSDGIMHSRPRLLLPVLVLLLPLLIRVVERGVVVAGVRERSVVVDRPMVGSHPVAGGYSIAGWRVWCIAAAWVVVGAWFSAYMLAVFPWAI